MRIWELVVTGPRYSANDRLHWARANALKKHWRDSAAAIAAQMVRNPLWRETFEPPKLARAVVTQVPTDRRKTDPGNVAPAAKAAIDGLVLAGLLVDDDAAHLLGPDYRLAATPQRQPKGTWTLKLLIEELPA